MVEEHPPAVVDEHRPLDVALDAELLLLLADPGEVEERLDVAAAEKDDSAEHRDRDHEDGRGPACRRAGGGGGDDARGEQPDRARERAGYEQTDDPAGAGHHRDPPVEPPRRERDRGQRDRESQAGQRGEVVVAEERGLPVAGGPAARDPPAEELDDGERRRDHARGDDDEQEEQHDRRPAAPAATAAGASSAYSTYFPAVTTCSCQGYGSEPRSG